LELLPLPIQRFDDPFFPFSKQIIDATQDVVCAYLFDFARYLTLGAAGGVALERSIAYARSTHITILHGPFATNAYAQVADVRAFGVDAVTLTHDADLEYYLVNPPFSAFIMTNKVLELPTQGGVFNTEAKTLVFNSGSADKTEIHVIGERALYAGKLDDFAEKTYSYLKSLLS